MAVGLSSGSDSIGKAKCPGHRDPGLFHGRRMHSWESDDVADGKDVGTLVRKSCPLLILPRHPLRYRRRQVQAIDVPCLRPHKSSASALRSVLLLPRTAPPSRLVTLHAFDFFVQAHGRAGGRAVVNSGLHHFGIGKFQKPGRFPR